MIIPKLSVQFQAGDSLNSYPIQHISLFNHQILVDGVPVDTHYDGGHFYWQRNNVHGQEEHGILKLFPHGLMGTGVVSAAGTSSTFTAEAAMFRYAITIDQKSWILFEMGFKQDEKGNRHTYGGFVIPGDPAGSKAFNDATTLLFTIAQDDKKEDVLHVHFDVDPMYCGFGFSKWIGGDFNFTMDYSRFSGSIFEYNEEAGDYHGPAHNLSGVYKDSVSITEMKTAVQAYFANHPLQSPELKTANRAFPQHLLPAKALIGEINRSVEDLFTLPTPDLENLHELSFAKLKSLMLYAVDDNWRNWFGETKPDVGPNASLTQRDADLIKNTDIKSFLTDKFAVGYLTHAFSKSTDERIKSQFQEIPNYSNKLDFFWKGNENSCFAKDKGYNLATSALLDSAFASCAPGLSAYLSDQPTVWAQKLYDYCLRPFTLNGLALQNTLDGRKRLTHLCTLLHALDQEARVDAGDGKKITYATSLYGRVMDVRLNFVISRFSTNNKQDGVEFLTEFFRQYFNSILAGGKWQDEVLKAANEDLEKLKAEFHAEDVNKLIVNMGSIISESMEVLIRFKDLPVPARIHAWASNNPKIAAALGRTMTVAIYGFGIYSSIQTFMGWKDLTSENKTKAVIDLVDLSANIFSDISKFTAASKLAKAESAAAELMQAGADIQNAMEVQRMSRVAGQIGIKVDAGLIEVAAPELAQAGQAAGEAMAKAESLEAAASSWSTVSKVASVFARGMTILALGAACVCTGFQIASDFSQGQPVAVKVLDILEIVATGIAFLVEAGLGLAAMAGVTVCSAIPVIGVVAAVVGIAIAIVSLFVHRNPPPTPEENFVKEHSVPFINGIANPTAAWLANQKKVVDHLTGSPRTNTTAFA
ncbi:hypothetical protein [Paenibacillus kobensis]|uniref:hypothetical protein n=1 Tax=Paenibacillus kobensis TaxID=59841 RepID=UPI000FDA596F|nr:hypothetical protein [Paenibacillus kobensis]